jgi:hypothetical protein
MEMYEVVLKAEVTQTFRVIADNQREATERANLMFSNENACKVLDLRVEVLNDRHRRLPDQETRQRTSSERQVVERDEKRRPSVGFQR